MNPRPNEASYIRLFSDAYWQDRMTATSFALGTDYDRKDVDQLEIRMPKYKSAYNKVKRDLSEVMNIDGNTHILEVGCAFGFTLEWLHRDFGAKVYGIEPSDLSVQHFASNPNIQFVGKTAEEFFFNEANIGKYSFDVILYRHVFEAILDIGAVTKAMRPFLKKNGILLIYSPNDYYYKVKDPFHPYVFNPDTLTHLLNRHGFKVTKINHAPSPFSRAIALNAKPNYEIMCMAKVDDTATTSITPIDPFKVAEAAQMGQNAIAWHSLSTKEVLGLLKIRIRERFKS